MKANGAPEKLYLIQRNGLICYCRNNNDDIEYIRTDAFIEKAAEWIKTSRFEDYYDYSEENFYCADGLNIDKMIEEFKKAMKL